MKTTPLKFIDQILSPQTFVLAIHCTCCGSQDRQELTFQDELEMVFLAPSCRECGSPSLRVEVEQRDHRKKEQHQDETEAWQAFRTAAGGGWTPMAN